MKRHLYLLTVLILLASFLPAFAMEGQQEKEKGKKEQLQEKKAPKNKKKLFLSYSPPKGMSMPVKREGGATRGTEDDGPYLAVLTPNHTGLTASGQPSLFWYISEPAKVRVEVTLIDEASIEPLLEIAMDESDKQGVRSIRLSDHGIDLKPNVEYQWFVSIVPDEGQRSRDISATGMIARVEASPSLKEKLSKAEGLEKASIYAQEGLWYDALASLSELIEANPDDKALLEERISMLEQVGLQAVAENERKRLR